MKTAAFFLLAAAVIITALTSCKGPYTGPPITGSLEYQGIKGSITIHPTK